jgi:hypothetical protein
MSFIIVSVCKNGKNLILCQFLRMNISTAKFISVYCLLQSLYTDLTDVTAKHCLYSSALKGYEISVERSGHKRVMNIRTQTLMKEAV